MYPASGQKILSRLVSCDRPAAEPVRCVRQLSSVCARLGFLGRGLRRSALATRTYAELLVRARRPEQEGAAAHVAPAHELGGKEEPLAHDVEQHVHVLAGRHAAEQDHLQRRGTAPLRLADHGQVAPERLMVVRIVGPDAGRREGPEVVHRHRGVRRQEPAVGGDHLHAREPGRRPGEPKGVGQLPAKVEAAQEAECLPDGHPGARAQPLGQGEAAAPPSGRLRPACPRCMRAREGRCVLARGRPACWTLGPGGGNRRGRDHLRSWPRWRSAGGSGAPRRWAPRRWGRRW